MTSAIHDLPTPKDYGLGFNYSVWTQGTAITLANVPWNSDYRDIVRFDNQAGLDNYLKNNSGPVIDIPKVSYAKFGRPIRLDTPFHTVQNFNYLRAYNPAQPITGDTGRAFYYFIVDVVYVNPNCTEIFVQLDVWQTFGYGVTFGNAYIERGHIGIANEESFTDYGREFLTVPEGLDIGGEYAIQNKWMRNMATARDNSNDPANPGGSLMEIMVISTVSLVHTDYPNNSFGTVDEPNLISATGSNMENLPNGADVYVFGRYQFEGFLDYLKDKPWISQGIISIMAIPLAHQFDIPREDVNLTPLTEGGFVANKVPGGTLSRKSWKLGSNNSTTTGAVNPWRNDVDLGRYSNLKKFLTYPYTILELTSYTGTPIVIKPESWQDPDGTIVEVPHLAPPGGRIMMYPFRYNAAGVASVSDAKGVVNDGGEFVDMATGIMNFPTFSVLNNGYMSYLASNSNSIAFQHSSADWSQQKTMTGNQLAYNQATGSIDASKSLTGNSNMAAQQHTTLGNETAGWNALKGGANAAIGKDLMGVANSAAGYAIGVNQNNQSLGINTGLANKNLATTTGFSSMVRDTNLDYGNYAAKGDYENTIASINAKVQDARLIQPTTSGQVGGDAFMLSQYQWGWEVKLKMLAGAAMNSVGEFWLRYGYAVNRFGKIPASFMVMEKFTYWKLRETYITSSQCPETFKQAIRGIFEKGVTVWKNPADIGTIDIADNAPLTGIVI